MASRFDELLNKLNDPREAARLVAIRQLGERGDMRAVKPMLIAHGRRAAAEKSAILDAFWSMGQRVYPPLNTILLRDLNPILRADAAYVMGVLGHSQSIEPLSRAVLDPHEMVRALVVVALARFNENAIFGPLVVALHDPSITVRLEAAVALGNHGDVRAVDLLIQAIEQQWIHPRTMHLVINALGNTHDPRAVEVFADVVEAHRLASVHVAAVRALGKIEDVRGYELLNYLLHSSPDEQIRQTARDVLRGLGQF